MASVTSSFPLLHQQFDYLALVLGVVMLFGFLHHRFWRGRAMKGIALTTWLLVLAVLVGGWFLAETSAAREGDRMREMVEGYAPTYAQELARLRHEEITTKTSPDSPHYWQLVQAEKRWLSANPAISNIYTLRKSADGHLRVIVDSETDFNHDGTIEGEQEQRADIGAEYDRPLSPSLALAFAGTSAFQGEPLANRWGNWVTAIAPMRNFKGGVDAVLGVDFDASTWIAAMNRARGTAIGYVAILLLIIAGGSGWFSHQITTQQLQTQLRGQERISSDRQKLETLVNSIDGIVWESDAATFRATFVSRQCERLLGYTPEQWMAQADFWQGKLHPDDQWASGHRAKMVAANAPYSYDYRMVAADGRTVWIRENAAVLLDSAGKPLLVRGVLYDISAQKKAAEELEQAHSALVDSSRFAGMAEVATGVLHNVGNVLNSVNVSGNVISERLRRSKVIELGKISGLLTLQAADFAGFVARDPRGPHVPELISCITDALKAEHAELLEEVESITRNIAHIKEIVSMQQGFAKGGGIIEPLTIQSLVDDAIKINSVSFTRHRIAVVQAYEEVPKVVVDKHLVLQILVNLLRNAKQAIQESGIEPRRIVVKIQSKDSDFVRVAVQDTGTGIAPENLTRIFSHGFTTKKTGHGFGLHSSALAATGMGGSLNAESDGPGTGATFVLELPVYQPAAAAIAA